MTLLSDKLADHGNFLFRWRSYMPLLLTPVAVGGMLTFVYPYGSLLIDGLWEMLCALTALLGLAVRAYTVGHAPAGTSGGNTKIQRAASLNVTGAYSLLRHPLYLGNFIMWLGVAMFTQNAVVVAVFALVFWIYYERIMIAEETFLLKRFGDDFRIWVARTPAAVPRPANWVRPAHPFSWKAVVRREYSGAFAIIAIFTCLEIIGDRVADGRWELEPAWAAIFFAGLAVYLAIMYVKKRTRLLRLA